MEEENYLAWVGVDWSMILSVKEMIWLCKNKCFFTVNIFCVKYFEVQIEILEASGVKYCIDSCLLKDADSKIKFCLSFLIFN
jgi:hypothetical protein